MRTAHSDSGFRLAQQFKLAALSYSRNRAVSALVLVQFGDTPLLLSIAQGRVVDVAEAIPPLSSWDFSIKASVDAWVRFWQTTPEPGSHDIFALIKNGEMSVEGNLHPFMANLQFMKDLLALGRESSI